MSEYRPVNERLKDFLPVELRPKLPELQKELSRCQDCGVPFCHSKGCDLANVIPEINIELERGRFATALWKLLETSPFPEFTARVCPALCEGSCVQGIFEEPVPARLVEYEVMERAFEMGLIEPSPPSERINLKVAVVGSGPAGLAAAFYLNRAGARVTVFERDLKPGGFLRYGIPDFKLSKAILDRRIDLMKREGILFEANVEAGADISYRLLLERYDALIIASGARAKRDLKIPGRELLGIHFATDYLSAQNRVVSGELQSLPPEFISKGKRVVVIGGGDTGSDCVGTANRLGALKVSQFEIMPEPPKTRAADNPWPEWPRILRTSSSHEEGSERRWNIDTLEFLPGKDGNNVNILKLRLVEWSKGRDGKLSFKPIPGSEFHAHADMVLLAMGFTGPEPLGSFFEEGLRPNSLGLLKERVYLTGDALSGPSLVVKAIASGLRTARIVLEDFAPMRMAL
jgi:glutamate synthase (NADPH/NADH) small chain